VGVVSSVAISHTGFRATSLAEQQRGGLSEGVMVGTKGRGVGSLIQELGYKRDICLNETF